MGTIINPLCNVNTDSDLNLESCHSHRKVNRLQQKPDAASATSASQDLRGKSTQVKRGRRGMLI